jgi:hypothetical protein
MKFTRLGRDYFLALLFLAGAGILEAEELFAGLALALAASSLISAALLANSDPAKAGIRALDPEIRLLKGEEGKVALEFPRRLSPWVWSEVESGRVNGAGSWGRCDLDEEKRALTFRLSVSGRFRDISIGVKLRDSLGLFVKTVGEVRVPVTIDSLPVSLLQRTRLPYVSPLVLGENPGGTPGRGQEFFGVVEYNERSESKDIMWKRAARAPDKPLMARVRESNIPERVLLTVVHGEMTSEEKVKLVDLQCEALGAMGSSLLEAGVDAALVCPDGDIIEVEDDEGLAEALMEASTRESLPGVEPEVASSDNIVVLVGKVGEKWSDPESRVPEVVVGGASLPVRDRNVTTFTGFEDLTSIVSLVLSS